MVVVACARPTRFVGMRQVRALDVLHIVVLHEDVPANRVGVESRSKKLSPQTVVTGKSSSELTAPFMGKLHEIIGESNVKLPLNVPTTAAVVKVHVPATSESSCRDWLHVTDVAADQNVLPQRAESTETVEVVAATAKFNPFTVAASVN